ncbi:N-acetyllactosaminide beta-1,3-N-acetylglucosaminyltransferase 3 [Echinops telfairi]|uniref:Hexosyltransferase n=1 Tax=Echinops telfairi TaxID=9371 RepID=A0ABM0ZTB1_ECHTE|nr:N-acetyllactosaminide beta-1,3-N-acetylglucosaminyltransferase 3 [Echinops telfairi]
MWIRISEAKVALALALSAFTLLFLVILPASPPTCLGPVEPPHLPKVLGTWRTQAQRPRPARCLANTSVVSQPNFTEQPPHVRDFLLYKAGSRAMFPKALFLQWQGTRCSNVSFLFNGDDDVFAHTDNMVAYLQGHDPSRHLFSGHLITNVGPIRIPWSKYYIPKVVLQKEEYPPYCGGGGFLLSRFTADALRRAAAVLDLFPIDDVFLGMCLEHEGLKPTRHSGIRTGGMNAPSPRLPSFDPCFYRELLLVHRFLPYEMLLMWEALSQPDLVCGKRNRLS